TGKLLVENIGFPQKLLNLKNILVSLVQKEDAVSMIPQRPRYSHKGTYGHVLLIAGSRGKTGAAFMSAKSCLRAGAGLVTIGVPESLVNVFQSRITEEMILPLPDKGDGTLSYKASESILRFLRQKANVLAIGPGLSVSGDISKLVSLLIVESKVPLVIDADAINAIAGHTNILRKSKAPVLLTPHPGEMARLLQQGSGVRSHRLDSEGQGSDARLQTTDNPQKSPPAPLLQRGVWKVAAGFSLREEIEQDRINTAISFARKTKTYLVLKGAPTVIAAPDGQVFINSTGNPGMATAGTGDVLTGMISAFLAQGLTPQDASVLGVYMHGFIGDIVAGKKGMHSLIASDIVNAIPKVFKMTAVNS
ncbi:MAG: ADP/ATP-dependent (S)-NAD(P)H-hydrate dehydratase, partial [Nitrospirota bacterium]